MIACDGLLQMLDALYIDAYDLLFLESAAAHWASQSKPPRGHERWPLAFRSSVGLDIQGT
jgi:hypothetical protein